MTRPDGYDALPRRFKDYVQALEDQVATLKRDAPTTVKTSIRIKNYLRAGPDGNLDDGSTYLADGTRLEFTINRERFDVYANEEGLEIMGSNALAVLPQVSNVVTIIPRRSE